MNAKLKALLVEDDRPTEEAFAYMLRKVGFKVGHARRGEEAIETAEALKPDVILLDIKLAGEMDGYAVIDALKKHPFLSLVPVLIVTNLGLMQDIERGKAAGAEEYLVKSDWSIREVAGKALEYARKRKAAD